MPFRKEHLIWLIRDDVQQYWAETGPFARCRRRYWAYRIPISNCVCMLMKDYGMTLDEVKATLGTREEIRAMNLGESSANA